MVLRAAILSGPRQLGSQTGQFLLYRLSSLAFPIEFTLSLGQFALCLGQPTSRVIEIALQVAGQRHQTAYLLT